MKKIAILVDCYNRKYKYLLAVINDIYLERFNSNAGTVG